VFYKSLFIGGGPEESASSTHLGIFMYLRTALGSKKSRALYPVLFSLLPLLIAIARGNQSPQNMQEAMQKNDLLDTQFDVSCRYGSIDWHL
jgi:hypothetical protein